MLDLSSGAPSIMIYCERTIRVLKQYSVIEFDFGGMEEKESGFLLSVIREHEVEQAMIQDGI